METKEEKPFIVARLKTGEDYHKSLVKIAQKYQLKAGFVLNSVGMMKDIELGFFQGKGKYRANKFAGPMEVTSIQGNFALMGKELKTHFHINLADQNGQVHGGHFTKGIVHVTAEVLILKLDQAKMTRKIEKDTGLGGLNLS